MNNQLLQDKEDYQEVYDNNYSTPFASIENSNGIDSDLGTTLLQVEHLSQYFKMGSFELKAVNDVSFDIKKGEVFGLVGESGCGKTTTGRSIIKLYEITGGNVYFKGERISAGLLEYKNAIKNAKNALKAGNITAEEYDEVISENKSQIKKAKYDNKHYNAKYRKDASEKIIAYYDNILKDLNRDSLEFKTVLDERNKKLKMVKKDRLVNKIQMIFQDPIASLDPRMTVREIIAEGLKIKGVKDDKEIDEKVFDVLEKVGLVREHANRYPHEFSGGQRQRIGVARAIIMEPELIIADEPVSALDVSIQAQVINLLNDLRNELGLTIMFIAHDLSVVKYFSDRIGVMYFGNLVELATSDELFAHPLHPYTRSLLSAIPLPDPFYEKQRKRIVYNPLADHSYGEEKPTLKEVEPGHFVLCDSKEFVHYQNVIAGTEKPYAMSNFEGNKVESE